MVFFHYSKSLNETVADGHMKSRYEKDENLQHFVKVCGAMAHLPLEDMEKGLKFIDEKYDFDDEELANFKIHFLNYIKNTWFDGPFPPSTWNCWSRSEELTNNNQGKYTHNLKDFPAIERFFTKKMC